MVLKIDQLLDANSSIFFEYSVKEFLKAYAADYNDAGRKLYVGIVSDSLVFTDNLIKAARHYFKDHRNKMQRFYVALITLLVRAAQVEMSYHQLNGQPNEYLLEVEHWWNKSMEIVDERFRKADEEIVNNSVSRMADDIVEFYGQHSTLEFSDFEAALYNILSDKYPYLAILTLMFSVQGGFQVGSAFACYQGTSKWNCVTKQQNPNSRTLMFHLDSWRGLLVSSQLGEAKPCMTEDEITAFWDHRLPRVLRDNHAIGFELLWNHYVGIALGEFAQKCDSYLVSHQYPATIHGVITTKKEYFISPVVFLPVEFHIYIF